MPDIAQQSAAIAYARCCVSVAPLRREAAHRSEQVSQLLFGERAEVLQLAENDWARIRCGWDGYEGWCRTSQLLFIERKEFRQTARMITTRHYDRIVLEQGDIWLPAGSELAGLHKGSLAWGGVTGRFKGKRLSLKKAVATQEALIAAAKLFLHAPYQWGGRTLAGIDCSGLVQMAGKLCGLPVQRDASRQAVQGRAVDFLSAAAGGDLAFFDNEDGRINHVGILLDAQTIIHATDTAGRTVIDRIDTGGIISISLRKRTHTLRLLRRILPEKNTGTGHLPLTS